MMTRGFGQRLCQHDGRAVQWFRVLWVRERFRALDIDNSWRRACPSWCKHGMRDRSVIVLPVTTSGQCMDTQEGDLVGEFGFLQCCSRGQTGRKAQYQLIYVYGYSLIWRAL
eukprot:599645-Amphidinium_carterae.1